MSSDLFFTRDSRLTFLYRRELILLSRLVSLPRRLPSPLPLLRSVEIHSVSFVLLESSSFCADAINNARWSSHRPLQDFHYRRQSHCCQSHLSLDPNQESADCRFELCRPTHPFRLLPSSPSLRLSLPLSLLPLSSLPSSLNPLPPLLLPLRTSKLLPISPTRTLSPLNSQPLLVSIPHFDFHFFADIPLCSRLQGCRTRSRTDLLRSFSCCCCNRRSGELRSSLFVTLPFVRSSIFSDFFLRRR